MKLIDKDVLMAEIEKEIKRIYAGREYVGIPSNEENIVRGLQKAEDIIDTLEVKEVDFGTEVYKYIDKHFNVYDDGNQTLQTKDKKSLIGRVDVESIAKHFFELGIKVQKSEDKFARPDTDIKDAIEVTSRLKYVDDDLRPIADFIMNYASWNLYKDEWNQPTIEVPLFRVLDALIQKGKNYYCQDKIL